MEDGAEVVQCPINALHAGFNFTAHISWKFIKFSQWHVYFSFAPPLEFFFFHMVYRFQKESRVSFYSVLSKVVQIVCKKTMMILPLVCLVEYQPKKKRMLFLIILDIQTRTKLFKKVYHPLLTKTQKLNGQFWQIGGQYCQQYSIIA